jgi:hypothetical protein
VNIDTLSIARELRAADLPDGQADAIAAAIGKVIGEGTATKSDLELTKQELRSAIALVRQDLELLRQEVDAKLERLKNEMIRWFIASQITMAAVIIAAIKL